MHAFVTVPGEASVAAAARIERAVVDALACEGGTASVIGFAGEYCGYWVTPEEYDAQLYEGASTLYGREASVWLQDELVRLVRRAMDDAPDDDAERSTAPECAGIRPPRFAAATAALAFLVVIFVALPVAMSTAPWEAGLVPF